MINQVVISGTIDDMYSTGNRYFIKVKSDEMVYEFEVWSGVYYTLLEKPFNTFIGIKGRVENLDGILELKAEKVTVITQN